MKVDYTSCKRGATFDPYRSKLIYLTFGLKSLIPNLNKIHQVVLEIKHTNWCTDSFPIMHSY